MTFSRKVDSSMLTLLKSKFDEKEHDSRKCLTSCKWHFASLREQMQFFTPLLKDVPFYQLSSTSATEVAFGCAGAVIKKANQAFGQERLCNK